MCAHFGKWRPCVKVWRRHFTLGRMAPLSNNKTINCWSHFHICQYFANSRLWRHLLPSPHSPPPPPTPVYSRPRAPLFPVFTLRSFGGASIILHSSSSFPYSCSVRDFTTRVLMSRRERRLAKWSYHTDSVGTSSWFWQQHLCHLH